MSSRSWAGRWGNMRRWKAARPCCAGQCLTGAPYAVESEADIAAVELCYREGSEVYAPWYRFWVKLPEEEQQNCAEGCTAYGAYYVPAVSGQFAADLPGTQWDYSAPAAQSGPYGG
ncbi:MAG: hypothetical protein ACLRWF_11135 [Ruthenibacterium sp.]